jgi:hypothetical protein
MLIGKKVLTWCWTCVLALALSACGGESEDSPATAAASGSSSAGATSNRPAVPAVIRLHNYRHSLTTLVVGATYSFTPSSSDPNGDTRTFSISGKPSWATFNTLTGALTGMPTAAGTHANIVISVSDGKGGTASLAAFTITVSSSTGSAVLSWTAPTLNSDGSPLTDLTDYKVYYGTNATSLTNSVSIASGTTTTTIPNLSIGVTYYFAIASVSISGGEGNKSNVVSKTI